MAHGTKAAAATSTALPNGNAPMPSASTATVNRKKQKRREKEAAKKAAEQQQHHHQQQKQPSAAPTKNGHPPPAKQPIAHHTPSARQHAPQYADPEYDDEPPYDENDYYSDEDPDQYSQAYASNGHYQHQPAYAPAPASASTGKKKKARIPAPSQQAAHYMPPRSDHMSYSSSHVARGGSSQKDRIWNTTTQEERERIREFWLSLSEEERKSLVKIEKEAVLRKMKEQQKHSCSCSVCGRKRTAIEEELEVLYDAYYEELEHAPRARPIMTSHPPPGHYDDTDELSGEDEEDEDFSNSEISSDDEYSEEERLPHPDTDFLHFGSSLQVKGGILTVADDLLKNDGKKFIEMMEQLAERRMQREEEAQYHGQTAMATYRSQHAHNHAPPPEEDEFDDEDDDEEGYEDGDYEEEDEDEDEAMTEEQRMEEGRRMFQIFAARMFEQRVLQAYKEKVAAERQKRLLEELAEEDDKKEQKEAKKAKEAQKRKEKKEKAKQAKQAEKEKREAELAAKEEEQRAAEAARQEEQRRKREEQRKKKEAARKAQEEERLRKEAERLRRQQEERDRQAEAERKARELKAQEKKARDEAKRKEREEREAKEKEAREKKTHDDKARKEREAAKAEKDRSQKEQQAVAAAQNAATSTKRPSQPIAPALPPQLLKQSSSTGYPSPHVTPAVPKAPTPSRPRQSSQQGSHGSSPKNTAPGTSSKSMSPSSQAQIPVIPKSILTKPPSQQATPAPHTQPSSPMPPIGPPPGMSMPPGMGLGMNNMPPGLNGFPSQGMMPNMMGGNRMPMFPPQPGASTFRPFPPPGMHGPGIMPMGRGFPPGMDAPPPGFAPPGFPGPTVPQYGMGLPTHSRHASGSYDKPIAESPIAAPQAQPIQRPTPIQRPSSVKPHDEGGDVDDLADHLGSKALLDDEEDIPEYPEVSRRTSVQPHGSLRGTAPLGFAFDTPSQPRPDLHAPFTGSASNSVWGTPPMPFPMPANSGWGNSPTSSMFSNPFSSMMSMPRNTEQRGINENRLVWLRRIICTTCKMLVMRQSGTDGYVDAGEVLNHVDSCRGPGEPRVSMEELKEACDIIGDNSNGGGNLDYKETRPGQLSHIKFVEAGGPPPTLGEIGSPVPGHSVPISGFGAGRPFPGLGQQGF